MLPMQQEMQGDEIVVTSGWLHVEDKAMDEVLKQGPQEHPQEEDEGEVVFVDGDGVLYTTRRAAVSRAGDVRVLLSIAILPSASG